MELALVTGAFKDITLFVIIEFAAQMCAFARKGPALVISIKEDKLISGEKARSRNWFIDFHIDWFFRYLEPGKT